MFLTENEEQKTNFYFNIIFSEIGLKYCIILFIAICFSIAYFLSPIFETTNIIPINWFRLPFAFFYIFFF